MEPDKKTRPPTKRQVSGKICLMKKLQSSEILTDKTALNNWRLPITELRGQFFFLKT